MRIQVDDVRLFFDVHGTKLAAEGPWMRERPTIVLLHPGPGFDHGPFKVQIGPMLAERAQVIYLDMRGAGRSDSGRPEDHRVERWADDVHGFCTALQIERPIVLGLGFGGVVALDYAAQVPGRSRRARADRARGADGARALDRRSTSASAALRRPRSPSVSTAIWTGVASPTSSGSASRCFRSTT